MPVTPWKVWTGDLLVGRTKRVLTPRRVLYPESDVFDLYRSVRSYSNRGMTSDSGPWVSTLSRRIPWPPTRTESVQSLDRVHRGFVMVSESKSLFSRSTSVGPSYEV